MSACPAWCDSDHVDMLGEPSLMHVHTLAEAQVAGETVRVVLQGETTVDGERLAVYVGPEGPEDVTDSGDLRRFAAALLNAADELDLIRSATAS